MLSLNIQQKNAVEHLNGPLLVIAGAGSGKTRVLTCRISHLIGNGVHPSNILAVTFTNKAAGEMLSRLEKLLGNLARELTVGTFHSICLKILRHNHESAGLPPNFIVYDDADQMAVMKKVLKELNLDEKRYPPRSVLERIMRAKDNCQDEKSFEDEASNPYQRDLAKVYVSYQRELASAKAVDFGDLIRLVVKLFLEKNDILEKYQQRWQHILVDEYQDTNHAQYLFIFNLSKKNRNVCVVGDDDQSIYRWRGAQIWNILNFEKDFPGAKVVKLEQNYRSTKNILSAANAIISKNAGRKAKKLWTENSAGENVEVIITPTDYSEAERVAISIKDLKSRGRRYDEMVVFYRINAHSRQIEEAFRRFGIPYRIFGGVRFYERKEIKDLLAYLRLVADPHDDLSLLRIINVPLRGVGDVTVAKLLNFSKTRGAPLIDAFQHLDAIGIRGNISNKLSALYKVIFDLHGGCSDLSLTDLLHRVLEQSGYLESLVSNSSIEAQARLENINEFVNAVGEFRTSSNRGQLREFLDQVALISDIDNYDENGGAVSMMTLHLAKGLEFPIVYMIGLEEGSLPHARSIEDPEELEEERRLCYVGMTRAKEKLTMLAACRRQRFGSSQYSVVSRFIDELPQEIARGTGSFSDSSLFDQRPPEEIIEEFGVGSRVRHPEFGVGYIRSSERTSVGRKVTVSFANGVTKRLIAEFANLVVVPR